MSKQPSSQNSITRAYSWLVARPDVRLSLLLIASITIFYELLWYFDLYYKSFASLTLGMVILTAIVLAAFRRGIWAGLIMAVYGNLYLFYALSAPGRNIQSLNSLWVGEWLIATLLFGPALVVGYLSDRVNLLLDRERQARALAEVEQNKLSTILQQLPVGVVVADAASGDIIFGNQYLEQLLGDDDSVDTTTIPSAADNPVLVSQNTNGHDHALRLPLQEWPLRQVIQGQTLQNEEYAYSHLGHNHVIRVNGAPVYNSQQDITAGVVVIDDITEDKEIEQRKDDFLSMVSHELKTPLTSLKMYIQLANRQLATQSSNEAEPTLNKANLQVDKLSNLITDMLTLARNQSGRLEYRFEPVDVCKLVTDTVSDLQATNPTHRLIVDCVSILQPIEADVERLGQVIINLVTNAIKYSPGADSAVITVTTKAKNVIISIQDFGIGIDPQIQNRIFERFYQVSDKAGHTFPGLGIGLYLCTEIIKQHHGKIWVESALGQGSRFYVSLPYKQPKSPRTAKA